LILRLLVAVLIAIFVAPAGKCASPGEDSRLEIGILKYKGGGDWYSGGRALANLIHYARQETGLDLNPEPKAVEPGSAELFSHPLIFINGHGNVAFTDDEVNNLRAYFNAGGFLFANDDYGMDKSFRREMSRILPEAEWYELPFTHPIYSTLYRFSNGLPKIHEHDDMPAQGYGLFVDGVMVCFYDFQSDLCDGWEAEEIHGDPPEKRAAAMQMGVNVLLYALSRGVQ
jgi:hypothetical protein